MNVNNSLRPPKSHPWFIEQHFTCHDIEFPSPFSSSSLNVFSFIYISLKVRLPEMNKIIQMCSDSVWGKMVTVTTLFLYSLFLFILPEGFSKGFDKEHLLQTKEVPIYKTDANSRFKQVVSRTFSIQIPLPGSGTLYSDPQGTFEKW